MATYPLLKLMERDSILYTILTFGGVNTFDMFFELCQLGREVAIALRIQSLWLHLDS